MLEVLVTGTGYCGTGYVAMLLTSAGLLCSHEGLFRPPGIEDALEGIRLRRCNWSWGWRGESSWLAAPFVSRPELFAVTVAHVTRHPKKVIDTMLRMNFYHKDSPGSDYRLFGVGHAPEILKWERREDKAAQWYISYNAMAERRADFRFRLEDQAHTLLEFLALDTRDKQLYANTHYNHHVGYGLTYDINLEAEISEPLRSALKEMTLAYGYQWPMP